MNKDLHHTVPRRIPPQKGTTYFAARRRATFLHVPASRALLHLVDD
jgi:hypothetical protein